jgi:uncharacterized membrane-anchored protein YitT (DUF2179 family)
MPSLDQAEELGRRLDHIERTRRALGYYHFGLGLLAIAAVLLTIHSEIFDAWLTSVAAHLEPALRANLRRSADYFGVLLPAVPYVLSWWRISDSTLETVTGVSFWSGVGAYFLLFGAAAIASDVALVIAVAPPASALWFVLVLIASGILFGSAAGGAELVATGRLPPDNGI